MLDVSERRVCRVLGQHRSTQRKTPCAADDAEALTEDIVELARQYGCYGYRRATTLLHAAGWSVRCGDLRRRPVLLENPRAHAVDKHSANGVGDGRQWPADRSRAAPDRGHARGGQRADRVAGGCAPRRNRPLRRTSLRQLLGRKLSRRATTMNGSYRPQSAREPPGGKPPNLSREGATRRRAAFGVPKRRGQRPILGALLPQDRNIHGAAVFVPAS